MSQRFQQLKDTVLDTQTGLEWQAKSTDPIAWQQAMDYVINLGNNWRLPTIEELLQLVNFQRYRPATDFPGMESNEVLWSSSSYASSSNGAWLVNFGYGYVGYDDKDSGRSVRCVRAGPSKIRNFEPSDDKKLGLFQKLRLGRREGSNET